MTDFLGGLRRGEMAADHFTIIANLLARDRALSCAAKGLFLNMASHREGFKITEEFLASQSTDGVKAIRRLDGQGLVNCQNLPSLPSALSRRRSLPAQGATRPSRVVRSSPPAQPTQHRRR
jgi:hypothetical protein